jgi:hypothetical protein
MRSARRLYERSLRQNGDPNSAINTVPQFLSPAQLYGPRNIRFNVAYRC